MNRSPRESAAIWLVTWLAVASSASVQEAKPTALPPIEVQAPQQRPDTRLKPKHGGEGGRRAKRSAPRNPASVANAAPAANAEGTSAASAPIMSSSEKNVSGADVNGWPFSRPAEALEVVPGLIITQHSGADYIPCPAARSDVQHRHQRYHACRRSRLPGAIPVYRQDQQGDPCRRLSEADARGREEADRGKSHCTGREVTGGSRVLSEDRAGPSDTLAFEYAH